MFTHPEIGLSINATGQIEVFGQIRGNDCITIRRIATSESRFTQGVGSPQPAFDALNREGQRRQTAADRRGCLYRLFC